MAKPLAKPCFTQSFAGSFATGYLLEDNSITLAPWEKGRGDGDDNAPQSLLSKPGVQHKTPGHPIPYAKPGIQPEAPGHPIPYAEPGVQSEAQQPKQQEQ